MNETNIKRSFRLTKQSGDKLIVSELRFHIFECAVPNDASIYYRTLKEIDKMNKNPIYNNRVIILHRDEPFKWYVNELGYFRSLDDIYWQCKSMRDELISFELIQ